jgi:predicted ATPase
MITSIQLSNFRALRDVEVQFERITLIVGPNSAGKTSILDALDCLSLLRDEGPARVFVGRRDAEISLSRADDANRFEIAGHLTQGDIEADVTCKWAGVSAGKANWQLVADARQFNPGSHGEARQSARESRSLDDGARGFAPKSLSRLRRWPTSRLLRLDPQRLACLSTRPAPCNELDLDGGSLAAVLATISATNPGRFNLLNEMLEAVVPGVRRVHLKSESLTQTKRVYFEAASGEEGYRDHEERVAGFEAHFELAGGGLIPAAAASEGTLLCLGLLTEMCVENASRLLLLDNLERGLHPAALVTFVDQLRKMMGLFPSLQVVATTHSPYLVDLFDPSQVRLLCPDDDGFAVCGRLSDHPQFDRWKTEMLPGEFWSMVGEKWLRDLRQDAQKEEA